MIAHLPVKVLNVVCLRVVENELDGQDGQLGQYDLKLHLQAHFFTLAQEDHGNLEDRLPPINDEVVPNPLEFPDFVRALLRLQHLSEERDEEGCAEHGAVDVFLFEV